jgi:transcriptional regulator with XRE-family HTH domain
MTEGSNPLGSFLRARRERVTPHDAGIPTTGVRRTPGLRREEVAMLAGVSVDYYLRLERGRDRKPSMQVLESLARVLRLDEAHTAHLVSLVAETPRRAPRRPRLEVVPRSMRALIDGMLQPAFIEGRYFDVLAANPLARALSPFYAEGANQVRDLFLDAEVQAQHPEWADVAECFIANLRQTIGNDLDDPRFIELVGELSVVDPFFRELWARHEVRAQEGTPVLIQHPEVGDLRLNRERLAVGGADGLMLVVFHADAGSDSAEKLSLLASAALAPARDQGVRS